MARYARRAPARRRTSSGSSRSRSGARSNIRRTSVRRTSGARNTVQTVRIVLEPGGVQRPAVNLGTGEPLGTPKGRAKF